MSSAENQESPEKTVKGITRRKAVKNLVGGVAALAAYNMFPVRWDKPIVEQVFLPAHAGTSSPLVDPCTASSTSNVFSNPVVVDVTGNTIPGVGGLGVTIVGTVPPGNGAPPLPAPVTVTTTTQDDGSFTATLSIANPNGLDRVEVTTDVETASNQATCAVDLDSPGPGGPPVSGD